MDPLSQRRLMKFVAEFRRTRAQFPTRRDLEAGGFAKADVTRLVRDKVLASVYVTLTTGAVVKGYKVREP